MILVSKGGDCMKKINKIFSICLIMLMCCRSVFAGITKEEFYKMHGIVEVPHPLEVFGLPVLVLLIIDLLIVGSWCIKHISLNIKKEQSVLKKVFIVVTLIGLIILNLLAIGIFIIFKSKYMPVI